MWPIMCETRLNLNVFAVRMKAAYSQGKIYTQSSHREWESLEALEEVFLSDLF